MEDRIKHVVREVTEASDAGRITFPEVVAMLAEAGVERYHADLVRAEMTFYMPDGATETTSSAPLANAPAPAFSAAGVERAVRDIQGGRLLYKAFCQRIAEAGCVGYFVSLAGRRAVYYGRTIDTHVEGFPGAR